MLIENYIPSVAILLFTLGIGSSHAIADPQVLPKEERVVSEKVAARLRLAAQAMRFTKRALPESGNQTTALNRTEGNSYNRMRLTRSTFVRSAVPGVNELARKDHEAARAAIISCTGGGNCGENSMLAFSYLKGKKGVKDTVTRAAVQGVDHAFVLIGDLKNDKLSEIVVADAWVTHGQPMLYTDFVFMKDRSKIRALNTTGPKTDDAANESKQARRTMTKALKNEFKKSPRPLQTNTLTPGAIKKMEHIWTQPYASRAAFTFKVKGQNGDIRPIRFTHPFNVKNITAEARRKLLTKHAAKAHAKQKAKVPKRTPRVRR